MKMSNEDLTSDIELDRMIREAETREDEDTEQ